MRASVSTAAVAVGESTVVMVDLLVRSIDRYRAPR
jgi:hypothetical protein